MRTRLMVRRPVSALSENVMWFVIVSVCLIISCAWWFIQPQQSFSTNQNLAIVQQALREDEKKIDDFVQSRVSLTHDSPATLIESLSKHSLDRPIPVQVYFHRLVSKDKSSLLACSLPTSQIRESFAKAREVWLTKANIDLRYDDKFPETMVDEQLDEEYRKHVERFTTKTSNSAAVVSADLTRIVGHDKLDPWVQTNGIHIYCVGVFVGNNAVTDDLKIFIRTLSLKKTEAQMDTPRFSRVLAHEIGHSLNLRHPKPPFCLHSCLINQCNLMCQQKIFPKSKDARFALSLSLLQVAIARQTAGSLDIASTSLRPGESLFGLPTETMPVSKQVQLQFVLFPQPMGRDFVASRLRFKFSRFAQCSVALVAIKGYSGGTPDSVTSTSPLTVRILAWASLNRAVTGGDVDETEAVDGQVQKDLVAANGVSKLGFLPFDLAWWTERRHVEAFIEPAVRIEQGEYFGIYFSSPQPAISFGSAMDEDKGALGLSRATVAKFAKTDKPLLPKFAEALRLGSFSLEKLEIVSPGAPIMNIVAH